MKAKISASLIKSIEYVERVITIRDTEIKGFMLRVRPSGGMTYFFDYKTNEGVRKTYRISDVGNMTPVQARDRAKILSADVAFGKDVQLEKQVARRRREQEAARTLDRFLEERYGPWASSERKTGKDAVERIRRNFNFLMERQLGEINSWDIDKWRSDRRKSGKAPSSINRDLSSLRSALSKAVEWGVIDRHPLQGIKPLKQDKGARIRYLDMDEEKRLRQALDTREIRIRKERENANRWREERQYETLPSLQNVHYVDHLKPIILLALNTGMRRGEIFNLRWHDINEDRQYLTIEGRTAKSGCTRHIPLNKEAYETLMFWKQQTKGAGGFIFPGKDGNRLDNVKKSWTLLLENAEITSFRFHDLRHHFASRLVMAGVDLNTVRELLGHGDISMTLRYAHLAPEHKAEAVARLDKTRCA